MSPERTDSRLLEAALDVTSSLDLQRVLENFVERACALTGARYAGLSVLDTWGDTTLFVEYGDAPAGEASNLPDELVQRITDEGYAILNDPASLDSAEGIENFLGVSVTFKGQIYARLYLVNRLGGFGLSALRIVQTLAAAAGIAVENAHLYADARRRARWIRASQQLTTSMLEGADEEEGLTLIAQTVRDVSQADTAIIVLPSVKDTWAAEITDGHHADRLLGVVFPHEGRAMSVLNEGTGMIVDSLARAQTMRIPEFSEFGPALYAPLRGRGKPAGVLILLRLPGKPEFDYSELALAESLAAQAALALELAARDRIGRVLHDFAIQQLFAAGMQLDSTKQKISEKQVGVDEVIHALDLSLASIDEAVRQIRAIVHNLREPDSNVGLVERIRRESSLSRSFLGFAPSLLISVDGQSVNEQKECEDHRVELLNSRVDDSRSDDAVAIVREGLSNIARHAHATAGAVNVELQGSGKTGRLTVSVSDDGIGIDPAHTRNSGLANMAERARLNGGTFTIGTGLEGKGTKITWSVPLA